eukprot:11485666-Ditylum_brightwellii.AAC.1
MAWHQCFHRPAVYAAPSLPWPASAELRHLLRKGPCCSPCSSETIQFCNGIGCQCHSISY